MTTGAAAAALARVEADRATCTYALWVPRVLARDTVRARARWEARVRALGFEPVGKAALRRDAFEWYMVGGVRTPEG